MTTKVLESKKRLRLKRKLRIKDKVTGDAKCPRISVFRSNKYLYAQAVDDEKGVTLASVDSKKLGLTSNKENAKQVAKHFAKDLSQKGIIKAVFDRNGYLYHGVVATFADSLRENGITL